MTPLFSYKWTTAVIGIVIALTIFVLIRKNVLHVRRSLWWIVVAFAIVIAGFFPTFIDRIGVLLGVNYPPVLILTLAVGFVLIKILSMDLERSRQEQTLRRLVQKLAILESAGKEAAPSGEEAGDDVLGDDGQENDRGPDRQSP